MASACNCPAWLNGCSGKCSSATFRPQAGFSYSRQQPNDLHFTQPPFIASSHTGPTQIDPNLLAGHASAHSHGPPKRSHADDTNSPNKRPRAQPESFIYNYAPPDPNPPSPTSPNGYPSAAAAHPTSDHRYQSKLRKPAGSTSKTAATDVYYFLRALSSAERPETLPADEPILTSRPKATAYPFVGCKLCTDEWTVFSNANGQTATIRKHHKTKHPRLYRQFVISEKLKGWETIDDDQDWAACYQRAEFTVDGFYERLIRWIAADDQSLNVVDCPELRDLLLYIGTYLEPSMIPHRTKLADLIMVRFIAECDALQKELESALGSISFTSDMWSRRDQNGFMAITAHFIAKGVNGKYFLRSRLIAFRHISGSHTGEHLAEEFVKVLDQFGITRRIGWVTLDNASVCAKMMQGLERRLKSRGIPFDRNGNRIHCFPHVINIAVQASLRKFTWTPKLTEEQRTKDAQRVEGNPDAAASPFEDTDDYVERALDELLGVDVNGDLSDDDYWAILGSDVVKRARRLVGFMRASIGRREKLANEVSALRERNELPRRVVLLKDMDVRWSSTFLMLDRLLELYTAIRNLKQNDSVLRDELEGYMLSDADLIVLNDITTFLSWPHKTQELVSSERTPTLSVVIPVYESLRDKLASLRDHGLTRISTAIRAATDKLDTYFNMARRTPVYSIAMLLNPGMKFTWVEKHCDAADEATIRAHVVNYMLQIQQAKMDAAMRDDATSSPATSAPAPSTSAHPVGMRNVPRPTANRAAANLNCGLASLMHEMQAGTEPTPARNANGADRGAQPRPFVDMSKEERDEHCRDVVNKELHAYIDAGLSQEPDLLHFWQVHQSKYPLLHRVAMDVLPIQASSVPCERVFSSGKETDTLRRSSMSPLMLEMLQVLKYGFVLDRVSFAEEWANVSEDDLQIVDIPDADARQLLARGAIDELNQLMDSALDVVSDDGLD